MGQTANRETGIRLNMPIRDILEKKVVSGGIDVFERAFIRQKAVDVVVYINGLKETLVAHGTCSQDNG